MNDWWHAKTFVEFFPTYSYKALNSIHFYEEGMKHIANKRSFQTTQMCLLNEVKDYDFIYICYDLNKTVIIVNNHDGTYECENTDKEIRYVHNFFKLWESGVFDAA